MIDIDSRDLEPVVRRPVKDVIFIAEFLAGDAFLQRLGLGRGPVLIRPTYI